MIFRQLFDNISYTYTYLLASRHGGEALIIDPVIDRVDHYLRLLEELDLKLVKAIDTHIHADHITALGSLRDTTQCITVMGMESSADVVSMRVSDGDVIDIEGLKLDVLYTPGHTSDSYSFLMDDRVFTGDTMFIRGTGRTDFQHGDPADLYRSIFNKLLKLPDETLVYPGHDYKGDTISTIGEERAFSPRLQAKSIEEFVDIMNNLDLPNPKLMDVAVPANQAVGMVHDDDEIKDNTISAQKALSHVNNPATVFVDLREENERNKFGVIPGSVHIPYTEMQTTIAQSGELKNFSKADTSQQILLYCAYGERSALALTALHDCGYNNVWHLEGGMVTWLERDYPLTHIQ